MNYLSDDARLGWVAGIIEGEGWIGTKSSGGPTVQVASTDKDVILRLFDWTGLGTVSGPKRGTIKPVYIWRISARDDAGDFLQRILPLMCERRAAKAREVLAQWRALPPKRGTATVCRYGHPLSGDNLHVVDGRRRCRACGAARQQRYRDRRAEQDVPT